MIAIIKIFKKMAASIFLAALFINGSSAQEQLPHKYISDQLIAYGRTGDGDDFRIATALKAGERVEVLEVGKKYTKIRDQKNRVSWVLSSYVVDEPSARMQAKHQEQMIADLNIRLKNINNDWKVRQDELLRQLQSSERQNYELLQTNADIKRELTIIKNRNSELEIIQDSKQREMMLQWFIYGGGVVLVGIVFGLMLPLIIPQRRRKGW